MTMKMRPTLDGWVGYGDRQSILLATDELLDDSHPVVKERPELFEAADEPKRPARKAATS